MMNRKGSWWIWSCAWYPTEGTMRCQGGLPRVAGHAQGSLLDVIGSRSSWTRPGLDSQEAVLALIERQISDGHLGPGARLPTERELALLAGVARSAVRRALGSMEAQ